ncbi:hypothetical protein VRK_26150 [Vibrio sp. MEBiC08052]|nr:hypothetical protein VRK_26150 [Vibrio sp. MEBiC08052]
MIESEKVKRVYIGLLLYLMQAKPDTNEVRDLFQVTSGGQVFLLSVFEF